MDVMYMEEACLALLLHNLNKGPYVSNCAWPKFKLELHHVDLILTPSLPLDMSCLSSNPLLNWWQTPGVLQHTQIPLIDLREPHVRSNMSYVLLCKILSKTPSHLRRSDLCLQVRTVPFLNRPRWCSSHFKTHRYEYVTWNIFYACIIS